VCTQTFNSLPLAALVSSLKVPTKLLCIHGGLSPQLSRIADIESIDRFRELPADGPMANVVWSDPNVKPGFNPSPRGAVGFEFGADITKRWNRQNGLDLTVRAHQLVMTGLEYGHFNQILTVFSAPDYCMRCGNRAGILELDEHCQRKEIRFDTVRKGNNNDLPRYFSFADT
jgi:serine/threonine-protein phosphatase 2A catalytic subunit